MSIPTPMKNLYVTNTSLGQATGIQATGCETAGLTGFLAIKFKGGLGFLRQVHQLGNGSLHPVGHFMLSETSQHLGITKALVVLAVKYGEGVKLGPTIFTRNTFGIAEVEYGVALASQKNALVIGRHESRSPQATEQALLRVTRIRVHHDIVWQVLVHAPQTVA